MTADLVARLAQEIRRVDGSHSLGAGALAEALAPFVEREAASALRSSGEAVAFVTRAGNLIGGLIWTDAGRNADLPDGTKLYLHPATPASAWRPKPESEGWYWHFDGAVMWMRFVYPRPGHNYLAVEDPEHPVTGQRSFRMTEKMGGYWIGPLPYPTPPSSTKA